jgi:hypothetical protein
MLIAASSWLGLVLCTILLKSPNAVLFAAAFKPAPPGIVDKAGLDLFR